MNVAEAKVKKHQLEADIFDLLVMFEKQTQLEVAAVIVERLDIGQMGGEKKSSLGDLEVIVGVDIPPTPKGGMQ